MKKKIIWLCAAVVALLAMIAALMLLRGEPAEAGTEASPESEAIYIYGDASTAGLAPLEINIHNEYGDVIIDNPAPQTASEPTVRGMEGLSLDTYGLGQAVSGVKAMQAKDVISENAGADDIKTFGLDNPRAVVSARFPNGDSHVIQFGINAPGGEGVYVKLKNENKIYLISDSTALPYFKPATAYVNKTVTATDPDFKGFNKITLSGTAYPETLVIERTPENEISAGGITLNTHAFTSPVKRGVDTQNALEALHSVYGLLANDVVAVDDSAAALEKYGLTDPPAVVSVVGDTPEMTFTLRISSPDESGEIHLIKDGGKVIYELSPTALPFLSLSMFDMMDKMVLVPNIKGVSRVVFKTPQKTYDFALTQDENGDNLEVALNGTPLPGVTDESGSAVPGGENFRKLYQSMIVCRYDEPIPNTETGAEVPEAVSGTDFLASIEYIYNNGLPSDVLSFYAGPPRKVIVRLNGGEPYYTQSIYFDRLLEDAEKVSNGIKVESYL